LCFEIIKLISVESLTYKVKKKKSSGGNWGHILDKQHGELALINEIISFLYCFVIITPLYAKYGDLQKQNIDLLQFCH